MLYQPKEKCSDNKIYNYCTMNDQPAFTAQRNLADLARGLVLHSSADGRMGSGATSL